MKVLEAIDVVKGYRVPGQKPIRVLDGVSLSVEEGERVAVMGRSGAGKTTLLNVLGGLDRPTTGKVWRVDNVGFVFQGFHLMPELTVLENAFLPAMSGRARMRDPRRRAAELLERVGLGGRLGHLPAELSGGEQQRVAIARALMCDPALIFADEPTGNLDKLTGAEILKLLLAADETPRAVVMVTHSAEAAALCDRTLVLSDGRVEQPPAPSSPPARPSESGV